MDVAADTLNEEQLRQLKELIGEAVFEIEFQGEDLVLSVDYQPPCHDGSSMPYSESIARISLRRVVGSFVSRLIDSSLDTQETRNELFALSGRLREAANILEREAESLNEEVWGINIVPRLELIEEEETEAEASEMESPSESGENSPGGN
jgi:hypothetical protein